MKNGFSTLNRLLGKKSKSNTNLSKSTTNLSVTTSTTNIDDSSQMQQNRITPLPVATSNAPFEQTFRITVLLPKDQLYVARLGARVLLQKLLELVCENKQLDADKYEFRHPADPSQVFGCDLTIGAVGLSEIRLCHKSESYDTFNADEIIKLHRTTAGRDSVSSSEFSSRNSKHAIKTPSPYSSSNSLNSMDSTGMNSSYHRHSTPKGFAQPAVPPVAPTRKKRLAPRPPSQNSIPEKAIPPSLPNSKPPSPTKIKPSSEINGLQPIPRKDFHVSSPNLSQSAEVHVFNNNDFHKSNLSIDCNGNTKCSPNNNNESVVQNGIIDHSEENGGIGLKRPTSLHILHQKNAEASNNCNGEVAVKNARNSYNSVQNLSTIGTSDHLPEPSPRKKAVVKAKKAAPAPPARFLQSPTDTIPETPLSPEEVLPPSSILDVPRPVALPRTSAGRSTPEPTDVLMINSQNVSKTLLNRSPTPEPRATGQNTELIDDSFDNQSKQADSGIGEALPPSPMPSSAQNSPTQCKSPFESSSDDDEMIKVYNLKLGKTIVKNLSDHKTFEDLTVLSTDESEPASQARTPAETASIKSEATSWSNFTIPAPPNFADTSGDDGIPDTPITPIIKERPPLDFTSLTIEQTVAASTDTNESPVKENKPNNLKAAKEDLPITKLIAEVNAIVRNEEPSEIAPEKPHEVVTMTEMVIRDEFEPQDHSKPSVIVEKRAVVTKHEPSITDPDGIGEQEAKVISEMDSIINSIEASTHQKPLFSTLDRLGVPEEDDDEDNEGELKETKIYKKRSSITLNTTHKQRRSVNRSDSFHSTRQQQIEETTTSTENGVVTRSSSFLSLAKFGSENQQSPTAEVNLSRRRSSSEMSIGESPSLQSVEVMKSILNSRKNSLTSQSSTEDPKTAPAPACDTNHITEKSSPKNKLLRTQGTKITEEKVYRYSGPPSINFSTWSERPKVQVSIKNEGDYIFGGKVGGPNATTTATVNLMQQKNFRNSMAEPVTVNRLPFVRSVEYKKSTSLMTPLNETNSRYSIAKTPATPPPTPSPPATMPKPKFILGGRMSNPSPVVRGFAQTPTQTSQSVNSSTLPRSHGHSSVSILRSTSVTQADVKPKPESTEPAQPLFGQGTLRKTGLKEKILADQENDTPKSTPTILTPPQSAKIELKITKTYIPDKSYSPTATKAVITTPPPPPPPIIRAVVTKQNSNGSPTTLCVDPRDQLLSAIRNFKRDDLKRT